MSNSPVTKALLYTANHNFKIYYKPFCAVLSLISFLLLFLHLSYKTIHMYKDWKSTHLKVFSNKYFCFFFFFLVHLTINFTLKYLKCSHPRNSSVIFHIKKNSCCVPLFFPCKPFVPHFCLKRCKCSPSTFLTVIVHFARDSVCSAAYGVWRRRESAVEWLNSKLPAGMTALLQTEAIPLENLLPQSSKIFLF